jgi:hypothetical protein
MHSENISSARVKYIYGELCISPLDQSMLLECFVNELSRDIDLKVEVAVLLMAFLYQEQERVSTGNISAHLPLLEYMLLIM